MLPGGSIGGKGLALIVLVALVIWGVSGFFRVEPDELGVILRFGKYRARSRSRPELPPAVSDRDRAHAQGAARSTRSISACASSTIPAAAVRSRDVPEESLMLTGDENIVDVDFAVFWRIKLDGVGDYLFNIQQPEGTVKAVAESAMREVVGRSNIQPILTGARQNIETAVQELMQKIARPVSAPAFRSRRFSCRRSTRRRR